MAMKFYVGKRVLYKHNGQWEVGVLSKRNPAITSKGLFLFVVPKEFMELKDEDTPFVHDAEINDIFLDAQPVEDWMKSYGNCISKQDYITFIEQDESFVKDIEQAYVSDGEYYYYPVSKFNRTWLEKQPFDYIVRSLQ